MPDNALIGADTSSYKPYTGGNMLEQMGAVTGIANHQQDLQMKQFDLARQQVATLFSRLSALAVKPGLSRKDVIEAGGKLAAEGLVTPQQLAAEFSGMPEGGDALREWVNGHLASTMDTAQKMEAAYGHLVAHQLGNRTQYVRENNFRGTASPAGGSAATMTQGLTPGEQVQPQHVVSPTGQPGMVTTSEFAKSRGINLPGTESAPGGVGIPAPAPGKVTSAPLQPLPPTQTGLAPGVGEAAANVGAGAGQQLDADMKAARSLPDRTFGLVHAIPALERLGTTGTGPTSEGIHEFVSAMQTLGVPIADPDKIKDYDTARKYMVDWVNRSGDTGTNDKLAAMFAGSPSVGISNAAAVDIAKSAVALERMKSAAPLAFQKTGLSPDQYTRWAQQWAQTQDPRAYGFDLMAPEKRAEFIKSLSPREKAAFVASLRTAHDNGLTTPGQ